jgi:hypothetical protein
VGRSVRGGMDRSAWGDGPKCVGQRPRCVGDGGIHALGDRFSGLKVLQSLGEEVVDEQVGERERGSHRHPGRGKHPFDPTSVPISSKGKGFKRSNQPFANKRVG